MAKRLSELYRPGDEVEITFGHHLWQWARVVRHESPGVWVETANGRQWFVTNTRHIRAVAAHSIAHMDEDDDSASV
jgi:hypothetical protein